MNQERFKLGLRVGVGALICLLVAPIIWAIISGAAGLITAFVICSILMALMPAFSEWLTQLKFKSVGAVVSRAPIESLYAALERDTVEINEQKTILEGMMGNVENFAQKVKRFSSDPKNSDDERAEWKSRLAGYEKLLAFRVQAFRQAKSDLTKKAEKIDKAESIYEMAVEDAKLSKSFGKKYDFMRTFKEKTAFDAVDKASANSMASLRMALADEDYANKQVEGQAPVAQVTYDTQGRIVLGDILDTSRIPVPVQQGRAA